jgi:hypothetical protein
MPNIQTHDKEHTSSTKCPINLPNKRIEQQIIKILMESKAASRN